MISICDLGKKYRLGATHSGIRYGTLRDTIAGSFAGLFRRRAKSASKSELWALRNVSFDVREGEVVGIIGRNGAGKSTLLKIISQITEPSEGEIRLRGRVASLLEVGTGFHPELTGRENIFLNGAILGMSKPEIKARFDEIVDFAEVEPFLDTPVKRYSSGMGLKLAFAVAAHLEPEILLIDEVLTVGDFAFQQKCLSRMTGAAKEGRTVLFVSHNMPAVGQLCSRAVLIDKGRLVKDGPTQDVIDTYLVQDTDTPARLTWSPDNAPGDGYARLEMFEITNTDRQIQACYDLAQGVRLSAGFDVLKAANMVVNFIVYRNEMLIFALMSRPRLCQSGTYQAMTVIPPGLLNTGTYKVYAQIQEPRTAHAKSETPLTITVVDRGLAENSYQWAEYGGVVRPLTEWKIEQIGDF